MQEKYVVSHNGFEEAPLKASDILAKLAKKEFAPVDYVFVEEKKDWIMLADFQAYLDLHEPKSTLIPDTPPAISPYPVLSEEKKEKLLKQIPQSKEIAKVQSSAPPVIAVAPSKNKAIDEVTAPQIRLPVTPTVAPVLNMPAPTPAPAATLAAPIAPTVAAPVAASPIALPPPAAQDASPSQEKISAPLKLTQGEASYSLSAEKAGQFSVKLKSTSLDAGSALEVKVKSGKPEKVTWEGPTRKTVGQHAVFQIFAKDQFDNLVKSYSGEMSLKWQGDVHAPAKVRFISGVGEVQVTTTKAQKVGFEILSSSDFPNVKLPSPALVQFEAGPAEKLVLEGPSEVMAGEPVQVKVRAVDKYGNLAKLDAEVEVEVTTRTA